MAKKKYNLKLAVFFRFLRTSIQQVLVYLPIVLKYAEQLKEVLPLWVIPCIIFVSSVATAADKLIRELRK